MPTKRLHSPWMDDRLVIETRYRLLKVAQTAQMRKGEAILRFIYACAPHGGARFSDIQRFICGVNGRDYDQRYAVFSIRQNDGDIYDYDVMPNKLFASGHNFKKQWGYQVLNGNLLRVWGDQVKVIGEVLEQRRGRRVNRGYYCTYLVGYGYSPKKGLLEANCYKRDGRWFVNENTWMKNFNVVCSPTKVFNHA